MKNVVDHGFTVYVTEKEHELVSVGYRSQNQGKVLGMFRLDAKQFDFFQELPFVLESLKSGNLLQIYKQANHYVVRMGKVQKQLGQALEEFSIIAESMNTDFSESLIGINEQVAELVENRKMEPFKKVYRFREEDKHVIL